MTKPVAVHITRENYHKFKQLLHWRMTGERHCPHVLKPTEQELAFTTRQDYWVWAAQVDGELVGWVCYVLIPKPDHRVGMLYVDELWTANEFRRMGVAEVLMEKAIETPSPLTTQSSS